MWRILVEYPVVGGEKFAALIGPSSCSRNTTRAFLALAFLAFGSYGLAPLTGQAALPCAILGALSLALSVGCAWISGGEETLVCQGGVLRHRKAGVFGDRRNSAPVVDLVRCRAVLHARRGALGTGIRLVTVRGEWRVGRGLRPEDARGLVDLLERHLGIEPKVIPFPALGAALAGTTGPRALRRRRAAAPATAGLEGRLHPRIQPPGS